MARREKHVYGKAVVGKQEATRQRESKRHGRSIYGKKVIGEEAASGNAPAAARSPKLSGEDVSPEDASLSLDHLAKRLSESPQLLDRQIDAEFQRAEGPRKGALRLFVQTEAQREGGPRDDVIRLLEQELTRR